MQATKALASAIWLVVVACSSRMVSNDDELVDAECFVLQENPLWPDTGVVQHASLLVVPGRVHWSLIGGVPVAPRPQLDRLTGA